MSTVFNAATAANVAIIQNSSRLFHEQQRQTATGRAIFGAADDATRFAMSSRLTSRSQQINAINDGITLAMRSLEAADKTIASMIDRLDAGLDIARQAQSRGTPGFQGTRTTTDIGPDNLVNPLLVPGSRLTIATDDGRSFTYTFGAAAASTRWGSVVDAINAADLGIIAEFIPATPPSDTNLRFRSLSGADFRFGGDTDQVLMTSLGALLTGTGGTLNVANQFVVGAAVPTAAQTGITISFGGVANSVLNVTAATAIAAGSSLAFTDGSGTARTWTATAATTVGGFITAVNGMNVGVKAELVNSGAGTTTLRLRNARQGNIEVFGGTGAFSANAGAVRFVSQPNTSQIGYAARHNADHAMRLRYGFQYNDAIDSLAQIAANNIGPQGVNLLAGDDLGLMLDNEAFGLVVHGRDVSSTAALGLTQLGHTWTASVNNIDVSVQQSQAARARLVDMQAELATYRNMLRGRLEANVDFARDMQVLGDDLVAADIAESAAMMTALQTQRQFAVQALVAGGENARSLLGILG